MDTDKLNNRKWNLYTFKVTNENSVNAQKNGSLDWIQSISRLLCSYYKFFPELLMYSIQQKLLSSYVWMNRTKYVHTFIRLPMMMAHGPNRWWNERKSKICTQANRNDKEKSWLRTYMSVGQYFLSKIPVIAKLWIPTANTPKMSTHSFIQPRPVLSLGFVSSNNSRPDNHTSSTYSYLEMRHLKFKIV